MPAFDPNIPLNANAPQPINPLQTALQVAQYRAFNANGQAAQQQLLANQATSKAYQASVDPVTGQLDTNKLSAALASNPDAAYNYAETMKNVQAQKNAQQTYDTGAVKLSSDQFDLAQKHLNWVASTAATVAGNPNATPSDVIDLVSQGVKTGHIPASDAIQALSDMPVNGAPGDLQNWAARHAAQASGSLDQLKTLMPTPTQVDTGGQKTYVDTNPMTNPRIIGTTINNTLTPGQATAQVSAVKPDGKPGSLAAGQVAQQQGFGQFVAPGAPPQPPSSFGSGRYNQSPTAAGNATQKPSALVSPPESMQTLASQQQAQPSLPGGFLQTGLAPGVAQAADAAGTASGNLLSNDQQANAGSGQRIYQLQSALKGLQGAGSTGPGTATTNQIASFLQSQVPFGLGKILPGVDPSKIQSYDEANKYLTQYASAKASALGGGTDAKLATTLSGNASTHISGLAAQDVVKANIGLERLGQAQQDAWANSGLPASQYQTWASKFGSSIDPRVFVADQMDPTKVKALVQGMSPSQQAQFKAQYNWAVQKGYIEGVQ